MKTFQSLTHQYELIAQILFLEQIHLEWEEGEKLGRQWGCRLPDRESGNMSIRKSG